MLTARTNVDDTGPDLVFSSGSGKTRLIVRNLGPDTAYLGGSAVTSATGMPLKLDEVMTLAPARTTDILYAICASGKTAVIATAWFA